MNGPVCLYRTPGVDTPTERDFWKGYVGHAPGATAE